MSENETKTEYKPETVFLFRESLAEVIEHLRQKSPEHAAGRICQLEMDLAAHRNGTLHMTNRIGEMIKYVAELESKIKWAEEKSKEWFHKADDFEQECIELKAELRKIKAKGKK